MKIRLAKRSDATKLSALAERTFRDTFSGNNTAENIEHYCRAHYSVALQSAEIINSDCMILVAEQDEELVAYAHLQWNTPPSCILSQSSGEIQRIYVDKHWHGKGVAQTLMNACIDAFKGKNTQTVWLGVWEQNPKAISFYKKFNFAEVGEHTFFLNEDPQRDIIMSLELARH